MAILSKYSLLDARRIFMYIVQDETGVAVAEVEIGGRKISLFDVPPDALIRPWSASRGT